jgi:hypothetical protein
LVASAKARALRTGLTFELRVEDLTIPERCPALGLPLQVNDGRHQDNSPSLDRIDPKKGYVKGNVAVISYKANRIKQDATPEELEAVASWLRSVL